MIWIFGDSFSANPKGWPGMFETKSIGTNGASEYRIYRNYLKAKDAIEPSDKVIFCHTHWSRVFLKDQARISSRSLESHPFCDLIVNDIFSKNELVFMDILGTIWDEEFLKTTHKLYLEKLLSVENSFHISFFDESYTGVHQLHLIWQQNKGKINHMNQQGNSLVYDFLIKHADLG